MVRGIKDKIIKAVVIDRSAIAPITGFRIVKLNLLNIEIEDKIVARCSEGMYLCKWEEIRVIRVKPNPPPKISNKIMVTILGKIAATIKLIAVTKALNLIKE